MSCIIPPPPDTIPDLPELAPYVSDSSTWRSIEETAKDTVPVRGARSDAT